MGHRTEVQDLAGCEQSTFQGDVKQHRASPYIVSYLRSILGVSVLHSELTLGWSLKLDLATTYRAHIRTRRIRCIEL